MTGAPQTKSWRDVLKVHPAAERFPLMSRDELHALADDIKQHGLHQPCRFIEDEDGPVLVDGRNRLCALAEILDKEITLDDPAVFERLSEDTDPYAYVVSANIHRRHLSGERRQELLIELIARQPELSNRQLAKKAGVERKAIDRARAKGEAGGTLGHQNERLDARGRYQPAKKPKPRKKYYGDPAANIPLLRIQTDLLEQAKAPVKLMNPRTKGEFAKWFATQF